MSSRSGRRPRSRSNSRSRSPDSRRGSRRSLDRPWLKRSRSRSGSSSSRSRSRSPRRRSRRNRSASPVRPVMSKEPKYLNSRVFVANLASNQTSNAELQTLFEKYGRVVDTLVHHNGYGFIQFTNEEDARKSVAAATGTMFHGKAIKCNMAAEGKKGGGGGRGGGAAGGGPPAREHGAGIPPLEDRFGRDPYAPPYDSMYLRGRDLPPPPRDYRDLPPPHRELPPPPRDPFFDDPYRRPPPPDLYYDRFRDDPYRRDPYLLDPYRDPYRDPYVPPLYEAAAPKKPVTVDCEIVIMSPELRRYVDMVDQRLKGINLLTSIVVIREDRTIQQQVEDATRRSCLFCIIVNSQNELHHSLTINILHGMAQEHRNMPLEDAISLVARSFEKFLQEEKEKVAAMSKKAGSESREEKSSSTLPVPSKDMAYLLNLLADNQKLTVEELDKIIEHLQERRDKLLGMERRAAPAPPTRASPPPSLEMPERRDIMLGVERRSAPPPPTRASPPPPIGGFDDPARAERRPAPPPAARASPPASKAPARSGSPAPQSKEDPSLKKDQQRLQDMILNMMNGSPSAAGVQAKMAMLQNTATPAPPPPPPPTSTSAYLPLTSTSTYPSPAPSTTSYPPTAPSASAYLPPAPSVPRQPSSAKAQPSASGGQAPSATLINFDNPTVQKALDNLIQSGPNLLKNISASTTLPQLSRRPPY